MNPFIVMNKKTVTRQISTGALDNLIKIYQNNTVGTENIDIETLEGLRYKANMPKIVISSMGELALWIAALECFQYEKYQSNVYRVLKSYAVQAYNKRLKGPLDGSRVPRRASVQVKDNQSHTVNTNDEPYSIPFDLPF